MIERRDPTAATQRVQWLAPGQPMIPDWDPAVAIRDGYNASWIVSRCVDMIAGDVSTVPLIVSTDGTEHRPNAPLARLLANPAPGMTTEALLRWLIAQRLVTGQSAAEIDFGRSGARPVGLWPLTSALLRAVPSGDGTPRWFDGFVYGRQPAERRLTAAQVLYGWRPALDDYRQPWSPLLSARVDVTLHVAMGRYSYSFFKNGAVPATIVVVDQFATEQERHRYHAKWNATFAGPDNAGKTFLSEARADESVPLSESIHIEQLGISQKDSRSLEHQRYLDETIAAALGVPYSRVNASSRTYDNAAEEASTYWRSTVLRICRELAAEINTQLAPLLGPETVSFDVSGIPELHTPPEPVTAPVGADRLVDAGIITINEARGEYGFAALDSGGDELREPRQPLPFGALARVPEVRAPQTDETRDVLALPDPVTEWLERRAAQWSETDASLRRAESRWAAAFRAMFARQRDAVLKALEGKRTTRDIERRAIDVDRLFDRNRWSDAMRDEIDEMLDALWRAGFDRVGAQFGIDLTHEVEGARIAILARANQLAGQVAETTYDAIKAQMAEGVGLGESIPKLADRIKDVFAEADDVRATRIARTEVISGHNAAVAQAGQALPDDVSPGREWISAIDDRTREDHVIADGQVISHAETFVVGGEALEYPGDPAASPENVINCRCAVVNLPPDIYAARRAAWEASQSRSVPLSAARALIRTPYDAAIWRPILEAVS